MNIPKLIPGLSLAGSLGLFLYLDNTSMAASTCADRIVEAMVQEEEFRDNPLAMGLGMMLGPTLVKTMVEGAIQASEEPTWKIHWRCMTEDVESLRTEFQSEESTEDDRVPN